ncbi:hypothetical protein [Cryptosporangium sp. NPDC048952]|uniref:hypothetical protein n=1 Tax=Cryptosporangium sp. NPDC048952 TaxID=3363961 RepID=UPI003713C2D8
MQQTFHVEFTAIDQVLLRMAEFVRQAMTAATTALLHFASLSPKRSSPVTRASTPCTANSRSAA